MIRATAVLACVVALIGCASDDTNSAGSTAASASAPATTRVTVAPSTVAPSATAPATTPAPTTTEAPTTTARSTTSVATTTTAAPTTAAPPSEWRAVDPATLVLPLAHPCCGTDWEVPASPELPGPGVALPDGLYPIDGLWPADPAAPIPLRVMRFAPCAAPGMAANCDGIEPFPAKAMGVDRSQFRTITVPLDANLSVVYSGFEADASGQFLAATSIGDGTNLAQLATAVDAAYERRIASRVRAGEDVNTVFADVAANPGDGFQAAPASAGSLTFDDGNAPPVLFQGSYDRGAEALGMVVLEVAAGKLTLVVYAGFYS